MRARIYQPPKNAMQSGWAKTNEALYGLAGHLKEQQFVGL